MLILFGLLIRLVMAVIKSCHKAAAQRRIKSPSFFKRKKNILQCFIDNIREVNRHSLGLCRFASIINVFWGKRKKDIDKPIVL